MLYEVITWVVTFSRPTTAGIPKDLATIAVCEVRPPTSVTKPITLLRSICMVSAGERSWAATTTCSLNPCRS